MRNLLERLEKYQTEALTFAYDFIISYDSIAAVRALRRHKVVQKIFGVWRRVAAALRPVLLPCQKRGLKVIKIRDQALLNFRLTPQVAFPPARSGLRVPE